RSKVAVFAELHRKTRDLAEANRMLLIEVAERRRAEEQLRALTHRVVQAQETERWHVALDLHDNITQMLCAILVRSQALAEKLSDDDGPSKGEALQLREMLGTAASEVERISRNLRPGVLEILGLEAALRATSTEFAERTGLAVELNSVKLEQRLPHRTEVAFLRILQEVLKNVEQHARATHITVALTQANDAVQLTIQDNGIGFDSAKPNKKNGLGLLGMIERAAAVGGSFRIESAPGQPTTVRVEIPVGESEICPQ
ncbi:MAG: sensor histidine kinase, partial [Prosthecobacter sp.]|uniref:sensor histidine kinase n=1 Tax=Prosthecobacter sp. TaxID=1965333 RepID=UPI00390049E7